MLKKKIEVVELNKKEEKILLEESQSAFILFFRRHRLLIFLTLLILSLTILIVSLFLFIKNIDAFDDPKIEGADLTTSLDDYIADITSNDAMTDETALKTFENSQIFKSRGEVLLTKIIERDNFTLKFYSDGTALKIMKTNSTVTRINPLKTGKYGIDENGIIKKEAVTSTVTRTKTVEYPWGSVNYYSDNSAEVVNSQMDIFVRNADDINNNYISDNKVTYYKTTKTVGDIKLNYYYDGTIEVIKNGTSYLVRNESDLKESNNDITFPYNNQARIYDTKKLSDGTIIDYYEDGGAIIRKGTDTLSVRKSNSIIIKDNKIFEIVDNIYVNISKETPSVTYYTNGGAVINKLNGKTLYLPENSDIKYHGDTIIDIGTNYEELSNENTIGEELIKTFEKTGVIIARDYTAIVPKDKIIYDSNGKLKEIEEEEKSEGGIKTFAIVNNTNAPLRYRVVIEQSKRTTVDVQYLRYILQTNSTYVGPKKLNEKIWPKDEISDALKIKGTNYILIDDTIEPYDTQSIGLMLWADYDTIPNSMQDKYFYGTIRVYAWTEDKQ